MIHSWKSLKSSLSSTVQWRPALHKWAEIYSPIFSPAKSLRESTLEQNMPKYKGIREIKWCFEIVYRKLSQQRVQILVIQQLRIQRKYGKWNQKQDNSTNSGKAFLAELFEPRHCLFVCYQKVSPWTSWLITGRRRPVMKIYDASESRWEREVFNATIVRNIFF